MKHQVINRTFVLLLLLTFLAAGPAFSKNKSIPLSEKIGQMILIGFRGLDMPTLLKAEINSGKIGGVILLPYNIKDRSQLSATVKKLRSVKARYPLLVGIDQEGGLIGRLKSANGFPDLPSAQEMAATRSTEEAFSLYLKMAGTLKDVGINLNFAPVVDLNINPNSPVIGRLQRSFSPTPEIVVDYAEAFIRAHKQAGILTCLKHFPGHGSAGKDSHLGLTDVTRTWSEAELIPYRELMKRVMVDLIMTAHIVDQNVDPLYPASLSSWQVQERLRDEMGYQGVVITDDLQMGAVGLTYPLEVSVIQAVNSGSDILLFANYYDPDPKIAEKVSAIIIKAVKNGKISPQRIDESFARIRKLKRQVK